MITDLHAEGDLLVGMVDGVERTWRGELVPGGAQLEPGNYVVYADPDGAYYIDGEGRERRVPIVESTTPLIGDLPLVGELHTDANAVEGSIWVDSADNLLHAIATRADGQEVALHADVAHSDTSHQDTHFDMSHQDSTHSDVNHGDSHSDTSHDDSPHSDTHSDTPHSDTPHQDSHADGHCDLFNDTPTARQECHIHCDHNDGSTHSDQHDDHSDAVGAWFCHVDAAHQDAHFDASHSDTNHSDLHNDGNHDDSSHSDTHGDSPHSDSAHDDSMHTDTHSDVGFVDIAHDDRPVNLGP